LGSRGCDSGTRAILCCESFEKLDKFGDNVIADPIAGERFPLFVEAPTKVIVD